MNRFRMFIGCLLSVGVAATAYLVWSTLRPESRIPVRIVRADLGPIEARLKAVRPSVISACRTETVFALPGTRPGEVHVATGMLVEKGDVLLTLLAPERDAALAAATMELQHARERASLTCAGEGVARRQPRRLDPLVRESVSDAVRERAKRRDTAGVGDDACSMARQALARAQRIFRDASERIEALKVPSPIRGIVTEITDASDSSFDDAPLARIADVACLSTMALFSRPAGHPISVGDVACLVGTDGRAPTDCAARVARVLEAGHEGRIPVEVAIAALPSGLSIGAETLVVLPQRSAGDVVRIPRAAIDGDGAQRFVWKVSRDRGHVVRQSVRVGLEGEQLAEVHDGVKPGEAVAIAQDGRLDDGAAVANEPQ